LREGGRRLLVSEAEFHCAEVQAILAQVQASQGRGEAPSGKLVGSLAQAPAMEEGVPGASAMQFMRFVVAAVICGGAHDSKLAGSAVAPTLDPQVRTASRFASVPIARTLVTQSRTSSIWPGSALAPLLKQ
jgi:hypothetical protein